MHDKLSQAVKLYDQLLSSQVAHPSRRNTAITGSAFPSPLPQVVPDTWMPPSSVSSANWTPSQTQPTAHAQLRPPSPRSAHPHTSFIPPPVSHPVGYYPTSPTPQATQTADPLVLQAASNQGLTQVAAPSHLLSSPPQQGSDSFSNLRAFSPLRQGVTSTGTPSLPTFPNAPTLAPQSSYMPSVPQSIIQQPDRQEALLIDL